MRLISRRLRRGNVVRRSMAKGQSMAEFALVLVPIMLLLLGALQFGVVWATQVGVTNAVRDAAREASLVQPKADSAGNVTTAIESSYGDSIKLNKLLPGLAANVPFYSSSSLTSATVCYVSFTDAAGALALNATVTVTYGHPIFIPLLAGVLGANALTTTSAITIPVGLMPPYALPSAGTSGCSS